MKGMARRMRNGQFPKGGVWGGVLGGGAAFVLYAVNILLQSLGADRPTRLVAGLVVMALLIPVLVYLNRSLGARSDQSQAETQEP